MGSSFFKGLDPAGQIVGHFAGPNSFISKEMHYDPIMGSSAGKVISPASYNAGQAYGARRDVSGYANPTPYAGVQPTLQDATNGYVQQAQRAAQQQKQQPQTPMQQSPYGSGGW